MTNICAPNKFDSINSTCFTTEELIAMAKSYNLFISKSKLNPDSSKIYPNFIQIYPNFIQIKPDKKYLLMEFKKRFQSVCDNELCWTKQAFMNEIVKEMLININTNTFRPDGPDDPTQWLNTDHINQIINQYENLYKGFKFYGAVPSDCGDYEFCSLSKINFNTDQIGIIFNLDKHGSGGSHWVGMFIDVNKGEIFYCDSTGNPPNEGMKKIIDQFKLFYRKKTGKNPLYRVNSKKYQLDGSECGIYSCNFIIRMLKGENFDSIINNYATFEEINSCRNVYFNNGVSKYKISSKCE